MRNTIRRPTEYTGVLKRSGLIDVYKPNSPMTLMLIYNNLIRRQGIKPTKLRIASS